MLEHEAGTRKGDDPEELHDMRVATRRMRAALRVFGAYLDPDVMRPVDRGLRRTGRMLGAVRDLDVFHEKTMVYLDSLPEDRRGDLDPLLAVWQVRREHARAEMIEYFDSGRYPRFVEAFTACSTTRAGRPRLHRRRRRGPAPPRRPCPAGGPLRPRRRRLGLRRRHRRSRHAARALSSPAYRRQGHALHVRVLRFAGVVGDDFANNAHGRGESAHRLPDGPETRTSAATTTDCRRR